jgi:hypothetical protein
MASVPHTEKASVMTAFGLRLVGWLALIAGCSSEPITDDGTSTSSGGTQSQLPAPRACSAALKQTLSLVDEVSSASVSILSQAGSERTLYVDAEAGGVSAKDQNPWVYVALATGQAVALTDLQALESTAWDLAFKRNLIRTNSGDSGPGLGGAIRIALTWDDVDRSTLGNKALPIEQWFDDQCMLKQSDTGDVITSFGSWDEYDEANHILTPADVVYIMAGADGTLYKLAILDYYSSPSGAHGSTAAHFKLRVAPLP